MKVRLDFWVEAEEKALLEDYCETMGRTKSDVLRELIRKLRVPKKPSSASLKDGA